MTEKLVITFFATQQTRVQTLVMAKSIRAFGGSLADTPIWIMTPEGHEITDSIEEELLKLDVIIHPIPNEPVLFQFPYGSKPIAAAAAEELADGKVENLVWIDRDGLIARLPHAFLLPEGKTLGYRPTDIRNIGAPWGEKLTPFWREIYQRFDIPPEKAFQMTSVTDNLSMYPYFNAGLLVVRPKAGILRQWKSDFLNHYNVPVWQPFYEQNPVHKWLLHQVLLTGTILKILPNDAMRCLPEGYNYPITLHHQFTPGERVKTLDQITTGRIDYLLDEKNWRDAFDINDPVLHWLDEILDEFGDYYGN